MEIIIVGETEGNMATTGLRIAEQIDKSILNKEKVEFSCEEFLKFIKKKCV